ncbi:hypothetical protein P389DRAFT_64824 [Cystobasidium minutum MCA 4210]|uniref:uncharacterized protein n=1 Tax=Cystobasidium minutum MCA 4210 TaxID=1397322 RepID=UPI0034CFD26D|eukprot:jgi/Rhomi1/64824/CE64823_3259
MDLYGSFDPALASSSGANTPVRDTAEQAGNVAGSSSTDGNAAGSSKSPSASTSNSSAAGKARLPTIEQEIEQMGTLVSGMGKNLGSYWSSFRRQSETVLKQSQALASNAAKDLTPYLDKAKAELAQLNEQAKASAAAGQAASISELGVNADNPSVVLSAPREDKGKGVDREGMAAETSSPTGSTKTLVPESSEGSSTIPAMSAGAFFSKLQHQLSSNPKFKDFQHTFQNVQHDLKNKVVDFNKIDIHEAREQYEKAMNQGEKYWKVASKELSDLFGEAVRIVPPEGYATGGQNQPTGAAGKAADKRRKDAAVAAAGRKEMLLHRLRSEPAILLVDPSETPTGQAEGADNSTEDKKEAQSDVKQAFATFLQSVQGQGGFEAETWKAKVLAELGDEEGGSVLKQTYDSVVPSKVTEEAFWTRYFFRKQQIEEDEARRREILEGASRQEEEDFSWDMEDESASSAAADDDEVAEEKARVSSESISTPKLGGPTKTKEPNASPAGSDDVDASWSSPAEPSSPVVSTNKPAGPASVELSANRSSARNSSEEGTSSSYDVVSAGDVSSPKTEKLPEKKDDGEDSDSDWE